MHLIKDGKLHSNSIKRDDNHFFIVYWFLLLGPTDSISPNPLPELAAKARPTHALSSSPANSPTSLTLCSSLGCNKAYSGPDQKTNLRRHVCEVHEGKKVACPNSCEFSAHLENVCVHWRRKTQSYRYLTALRDDDRCSLREGCCKIPL